MYCECGCGRITQIAPSTQNKYGWVKGEHRRFAQGHHIKGSYKADYVIDEATGCWVWQKAKVVGYGSFRRDGRHWLAHRFYYEKYVGPIPEGLEIDHLCRNRACVNPAHMEAVTKTVNMRRAMRARKWRPGKSKEVLEA